MATVNNNISCIVENQLPASFRKENLMFVQFLKSYYQFLESIQVHLSANTGAFSEGEVITSDTNSATAKILSIDTSTNLGTGVYLYVSQTNNVIFEAGETITGSNGATGTIHHYRRNPLNASKVALDWSEFPSPNNELFYNFRYEFFENWPEDLDIDKKIFASKIKEVYMEKGDERSYQTLFRAALSTESVDFYYPKVDMLKPSHGAWIRNITLHVNDEFVNREFLGRTIVGQTTGSSAFITSLALNKVSTTYVTELYLKNQIGSFDIGEIVQATSESDDGSFANSAVLGMISSNPNVNVATMITEGREYTKEETIPLIGGVGVGAIAKVGSTTEDQVTSLRRINDGSGYQVGDWVDFDNTLSLPTESARAKVTELDQFTLSTVEISNEKIFDLCNTHVMTLSSETDIPIREEFLLSNYFIQNNASQSTKRGVVVEVLSNTVIRYAPTANSSADTSLAFTSDDTVYAFRRDGFAFTPTLISEIESDHPYTNSVAINGDYGGISANVGHTAIFLSNTNTSTLESLTFSDVTVGKIETIEIMDYGKGYQSTPTLSIDTNFNYIETNGYPSTGGRSYPIGQDAVFIVDTMGGGVTSVRIDNPGTGYGTDKWGTPIPPTFDFTGFGNGLANASLIVDSVRYYPGFYAGADGQCSSQKKLQDSVYYQDFSYVIKSDKSVELFRDLILNTIHPAGLNMFGEVILRNTLDLSLFKTDPATTVNTVENSNVNQNIKYRSFLLVFDIPIVVPVPEPKFDLSHIEWTTGSDDERIDGVWLSEADKCEVKHTATTEQVMKESFLEQTYDDVRFWSLCQTYFIKEDAATNDGITTKYETSYFDLSGETISSVATSHILTKTYEPSTLTVFINDKIIPHADITQTSGTAFTIPITASASHTEQLRVVESYVKIKTDTDLWLRNNDIVQIDGFPEFSNTSITLNNQKFIINNIDLAADTGILLQVDGLPVKDYTGVTVLDDVSYRIIRLSKELITQSTIDNLSSEYWSYYKDFKISDYRFDSLTNDLQNVEFSNYSANTEVFFDRQYIGLNENVLLETASGGGKIDLMGDETYELALEGRPSKGFVDNPIFVTDYQLHTIDTIASRKITLDQDIRYKLNQGNWAYSPSQTPALFGVENISIMKRT